MNPELRKELESAFLAAEDIKNLREGLSFLVWEHLEENLDSGVSPLINGKFIKDFRNLLEILLLLEKD